MPSVRRFSLGVLDLRGEDRVRFLHGMVSNDIERLGVGQGCHAAMLTTKGKLLADFVVIAEADRLRLLMLPLLLEKIRAHLDKHVIMDDVELAAAETPAVGVYGDDAPAAIARTGGADAAALAALLPYHFAGNVVRTPELGSVGFHLLGAGDVEAAALGGTPLDDAEFEERRIEAGTPCTASTWAKIAFPSRPASTTPSASTRAATSARR